MKNKKIQIAKQKNLEIIASLKQANQKSELPAKKRIVKQSQKVSLRFSPTAWAKLLYFRDKSDNEVGGFGITKVDDLLFVTDFVTVKQEVTTVICRILTTFSFPIIPYKR